MRLFIKIITGFALVSFLIWYFWIDIALFAFSYVYPTDLSKEIETVEQDFEKYYPQILADAAIMEAIPVFYPMTYNNDASAYLNPMVTWSGDQSFKAEQNKSTNIKSLSLNTELLEILENEKDFTKITIDWSKHNLDFSWFKMLLAYDHWNYSQSAPFPKNETPFEVFSAPTPDYSYLIKWSKLYLLYSRDQKILDKNSIDLDHLAKLIYSNQSIIDSMIAVQILKIKKKFHDNLNSEEQKKIKGVIISDENLEAIKRLALTLPKLRSIFIPDNVFNKAKLIKVSFCVFLEEIVAVNTDLKFLFNISYPNSILRIEQMKQQSVSRCPDSYAKRAWSSQSYQDRIANLKPMALVQGSGDDYNGAEISMINKSYENITYADLEKEPKLAKVITNVLFGIMGNASFHLYEEKK